MDPFEEFPDTAAVLAMLLVKIRSGDPDAAVELRDMLLPGLRTLLRFRVPSSEIEGTSRRIMDGILKEIRESAAPIPVDEIAGLILDAMGRTTAARTENAPLDRPPSDPLQSERAERIFASLSRTTTAEEREMLRHYYADGWTIPQIASKFQLAESSVRQLIQRIRRAPRPWIREN